MSSKDGKKREKGRLAAYWRAARPPAGHHKGESSGVKEQERLFLELSKEMGYVDVQRAKEFYQAFVRLTVREMRTRLIVRWPGFFDLWLVYKQDGVIRNINRSLPLHIGPHHQMRVSPSAKLRRYFREIRQEIKPIPRSY
jgi:hypothetical protein